MQRRIAVKRLTASDLTLFEWHFRNENAGNQKSINLNADVFIQEMFPSLPEVAQERNWRIPIDLSVYGPGHAALYNLQRKIVKGGAYKNWRLNGEFISDPPDQPERFRVLQPGDLVVFDFIGTVIPDAAKMLLIARNLNEDSVLYQRVSLILGNRRMAALTLEELNSAAAGTGDGEHPIHELTLDEELEDAAKGGVLGRAALGRNPLNRKVGLDDLRRAREAGEQAGRAGEELVFSHFIGLHSEGRISGVRWVAETNAVAPFDFLVTLADGQEIALDVKSTAGEFERPIHISSNELAEMAGGGRRYDIYRVFEVTENTAKLRIAEDTRALAEAVRERLAILPAGIEVDSVSVEPAILQFGATISLMMHEDDEESS